MMSSTQSVAGQPVAPPDPSPMHHGLPPSAMIFCSRVGKLFLCLGHLVAGFLEIVRRVPDQRLHVGLVGEGEEAGLAVLVLEGAEIDPGLAGAVILLDPVGGVVAERRQQALRSQILDQAGLRQNGDVGRAAGLRVDDDLLLVVLGRRIFHVDAGRLGEILENAADQTLRPRRAMVRRSSASRPSDRLSSGLRSSTS